MTLILLRIDNQLQCIVGLTFITGTKNFMVTTQSTNNDQITILSAHPNQLIISSSKLYSRTLPRITLKVRTEKLKRQFYSGSPELWKRRTHHLDASIRNINLAVTHKHTTQ